MSLRRTVLALPLLAACGSDPIVEPTPTAALRIVNGTALPVDVSVDGAVVARGVAAANVSLPIPVAPGARQVRVATASGAAAQLTVTAADGKTVTAVALPQATTGLSASVLPDTGAIVPAGKSKLRVAHLAPNAGAIRIVRTQPDFPTMIAIQTPFPYGATSPYLQSEPGSWQVWVLRDSSAAQLATTGPIAIPSGERRTVLLLDSAGVLRFRVVND